MDTQIDRVYRWERVALPGVYWRIGQSRRMSLAQCRKLINRIYHDAEQENPPRIFDGRGSKIAFAKRNFSIHLPRLTRVKEIVIHETAHTLLYPIIIKYNREPHGPEFVALYIKLLHRYARYDYNELVKQAKLCGVDLLDI